MSTFDINLNDATISSPPCTWMCNIIDNYSPSGIVDYAFNVPAGYDTVNLGTLTLAGQEMVIPGSSFLEGYVTITGDQAPIFGGEITFVRLDNLGCIRDASPDQCQSVIAQAEQPVTYQLVYSAGPGPQLFSAAENGYTVYTPPTPTAVPIPSSLILFLPLLTLITIITNMTKRSKTWRNFL